MCGLSAADMSWRQHAFTCFLCSSCAFTLRFSVHFQSLLIRHHPVSCGCSSTGENTTDKPSVSRNADREDKHTQDEQYALVYLLKDHNETRNVGRILSCQHYRIEITEFVSFIKSLGKFRHGGTLGF